MRSPRSATALQLVLVVAVLGVGVWWAGRPDNADRPLGPTGTPPIDASIDDAPDASEHIPLPDVGPQPLAVPRLESTAQFDAIAFSGARGIVLGKSVKFLVDARDSSDLVVHFMNAAYDGATTHPEATQLHYFFAVEVHGITIDRQRFDEVTYDAIDKQFIAGTLQEYRFKGDRKPTYAIQFTPQDTIAERHLQTAILAVTAHLDVPGAKLAFVPTAQQQTVETVRPALEALGVKVHTLSEVLGAVDYMPMHLGEAWGFLRVFPRDFDMLSAADIAVFDELPLDLTVVAGTITRAVQDNSSHINLKSKERGTPNMVLRSAALDHPLLEKFVDKPVHLKVEADGFTIESSTEAEVKQRLAQRNQRPWRRLDVDPSAVTRSFDAMCARGPKRCLEGAARWGGKASKLGFLRHPDVLGAANADGLSAALGYAVAPPGVGVPVQTYVDYVAENPPLRAALEQFIEKEKAMGYSVGERVAALRKIQAMFMAGEFPPGVVEGVRAAAVAALPTGTQNLKVRSSANAEDMRGFDGAGLYDSFRVRLSDEDEPCVRTVDAETRKVRIRPRTLDCVMKGVYASLWNKRAVEERSFARIDHATAGMGLAIVQRYKERGEIAANSVVITRAINADGVYGYTFSSQRGNNVVTNPEPGTHSESITVGALPDAVPTFSVSRYARPEVDAAELQETVMTDEQMVTLLQISQEVERVYCRASPGYFTGEGGCDWVIYDADKPTALDMEFKLFANGQFLCKQVREFSGK